MKARRPVLLGAALLSATLLVGCAGATPAPGDTGGSTPDGAALVAQRCTRCHPTDRIDAANHDKAGWEATVARMRGKGAQLTDAEAAAIVEYLASR